MSAPVAVITGGSSGIGRCTAKALAARGFSVYELSRRDIPTDGVIHMNADVTDEQQVLSAVNRILELEGKIDVLINNAGFGISGASEFTENDEAKRLLDVNLFGTANMTKAVLPHMRRRRAGRIICLSSVAGEIAIPFQTWYSVSKAAVLSFTMATASEVAPYNIDMCAVLPGDIKTGFTAAREKSVVGDDEYDGRISRSVAVMEHDEQTGMSPEKAGIFIAGLAAKRKIRPRYVIGSKYSLFTFLAKILPSSLVKKIVGTMYAK